MLSLIHKDGLKQRNKQRQQHAPNLQGAKGELQVLIQVPLANQPVSVMEDEWLYKWLLHSRASALGGAITTHFLNLVYLVTILYLIICS